MLLGLKSLLSLIWKPILHLDLRRTEETDIIVPKLMVKCFDVSHPQLSSFFNTNKGPHWDLVVFILKHLTMSLGTMMSVSSVLLGSRCNIGFQMMRESGVLRPKSKSWGSFQLLN